MYKFSDYISSVVVEMYLIQITSLSCVQLSDVNSTSGLRLRILSRLAVVKITTEKFAVYSSPTIIFDSVVSNIMVGELYISLYLEQNSPLDMAVCIGSSQI